MFSLSACLLKRQRRLTIVIVRWVCTWSKRSWEWVLFLTKKVQQSLVILYVFSCCHWDWAMLICPAVHWKVQPMLVNPQFLTMFLGPKSQKSVSFEWLEISVYKQLCAISNSTGIKTILRYNQSNKLGTLTPFGLFTRHASNRLSSTSVKICWQNSLIVLESIICLSYELAKS